MPKAVAFLLAVLIAGSLSCGNAVSQQPVTLHTVTTPLFSIPETPYCPTGCVKQYSPGYYISIMLGPDAVDKQNMYGILLPDAMHVRRIDAWMGTPFCVEELGSRLQIQKPNGQAAEWLVEYDKHNLLDHGQRQLSWAVNMDRPAGTKIVIVHGSGACWVGQPFNPQITEPTQPCVGHVIWRLYAE